MLKDLDTYDWEEAFNYAGTVVQVPFTNPVNLVGFDREDVEEIISMSEGENDCENWIGVFKLNDGRFAFLDAGCDYTGWDCQAWGEAEVCGTLEEMIRYGLTNQHRERLNLYLGESQ